MEKLTLKPEALFYLGKKMNGLYYNYDYYSAIPAVESDGGKKLLWHIESQMAEQGLLVENDDGDMVLADGVDGLLRPVFFGPFQAKVAFYPKAADDECYLFYFHWLEGDCRMITQTVEGFSVQRVTEEDLTALAVSFMPESYLKKEAPSPDLKLDSDQITQILRAGSNSVGGEAKTLTAFNCDGWMCAETEEGKVDLLSPADFVDRLMQIIKEGE